MTDSFDSNGLEVATQQELIDSLSIYFKEIYGSEIDLSQETPDGQLINIFAQGGSDIRSLLLQLYNSFDPDNSSGRLLDERCALTNVFRKGGTFTTVRVQIVTDKTVTLQGVDENYNDPNATGYTIQDDAGNQFVLVNTQTLPAGTYNVMFRARQLGEVQVALNTLTNQVTVVLGVVSVNNPTAATVGENEETDSQLKLRRRRSVALSSTGYLNGLLATVLQLDGVVDAALYENPNDETDSNGIPPHAIWLVVDGGSSEDIAYAMYYKVSMGCNMRGNITYQIITQSKQDFTAKWDEPTVQPLYLQFTIQQTANNVNYNLDNIKQYILDNVSYSIGEFASTSSLTTLAQEAVNNFSETGEGVSQEEVGTVVDVNISTDNATWVDFLQCPLASKFALSGINITTRSL